MTLVFVVQIAEGVPERDVNAAFAQFAGPTETGLARVLRRVCDHVDDSRLRREVCLRVCDAAESQALNDNFRGKDKPTNILSFPAGELAAAELPLGDLALCWPVACQEATEQHKPLHHHLAHLTVHGLRICLVMITNRTQKLRAWRVRNCDPRRLGHCESLSLNCAPCFFCASYLYRHP